MNHIRPYFSYERTPYPVDLQRSEIRLIALLPGHWADAIACELFRVSHHHGSPVPEYRALSYAWGVQSRRPPKIVVNSCPFEVTVNLQSALRHLRQPEQPVVLWVDAICINQDNDSERSSQVSKMREIYEEATQVVIFLGDGRSNLKNQSVLGKDPGKQITFKGDATDNDLITERLGVWATPDMEKKVAPIDIFCLLSILSQNPRSHTPLLDLEPVPEARLTAVFEALRTMLTVRWWDRIWVVQEAVVARDMVVMYGNMLAPWDMFAFVAAAQATEKFGLRTTVSQDDLKVLNLLSSVTALTQFRNAWRQGESLDILSLLRHFSNRKASDNRDKIYALLGLCNPDDVDLIRPDYHLDDTAVYKEAVLRIMASKKSLSALTGDLGRKNKQDLPSWVPDWSATSDEYDLARACLFDLYNACGKNPCCVIITQSLVGATGKGSNSETAAIQALHHRLRLWDDSWMYGIPAERTMEAYKSVERIGLELDQLDSGLRSYDPPDIFMSSRFSFIFEWARSTDPVLRHAVEEVRSLCVHSSTSSYIHYLTYRNFILADPMLEKVRPHDALRVGGRHLQVISHKTEPMYSSSDLAEVGAVLQSWLDLTEPEEPLDPHHLLAFAEAIVSGTIFTVKGVRRLTEEDRPALQTWLLDILQLSASPSRPDYQYRDLAMSPFTKAMQMCITRRAFFITQSGRFGVGPASMEVGDELYVIPGGNLPFVLRDTALWYGRLTKWNAGPGALQRGRTFKIIGDCFLQGLEDGQLQPPNKALLSDFVIDVVQKSLIWSWQKYAKVFKSRHAGNFEFWLFPDGFHHLNKENLHFWRQTTRNVRFLMTDSEEEEESVLALNKISAVWEEVLKDQEIIGLDNCFIYLI